MSTGYERVCVCVCVGWGEVAFDSVSRETGYTQENKKTRLLTLTLVICLIVPKLLPQAVQLMIYFTRYPFILLVGNGSSMTAIQMMDTYAT